MLAEVARRKVASHVGLHDGGRNVHIVPGGRFEQEKWTTRVGSETRVVVTLADTSPPGMTDPSAGSRSREKSNGVGGGGDGGGADRFNGTLVVREMVPPEASIITSYAPGGVLGEVERTRFAVHVGRQDGGVKEQFAPRGRLSHENRTSRVEPYAAVAVTVVITVLPGATEPEVGMASKEKSKADWAAGRLINVVATKATSIATTSTRAKRRAREPLCPLASLTSRTGRG